jgi:hypothetical protein
MHYRNWKRIRINERTNIWMLFFSQVSILVLLYGPPTVLSRSTSEHFGTGFTSAGQFEVFWSEFDVSTAVDTSWLSSLVASVAEIVCVG